LAGQFDLFTDMRPFFETVVGVNGPPATRWLLFAATFLLAMTSVGARPSKVRVIPQGASSEIQKIEAKS
jgi:hypothetical protein